MSSLLNRAMSWMTVEPVTALMMLIAAIILFGASFARSRDDTSPGFWPWLRRVIEAAVGTFLFLGLLWAFRSILTNNQAIFYNTHGSLSDVNLYSAYSIWGRPHIQRELNVEHFTRGTQAEQNSILSFTGEVDLRLSEREKGYAYYNGFEADARFEYEIVNDSDLETEALFTFPLSPNQTMFDDFEIAVDGETISPRLRFEEDTVSWTDTMQPHERKTIVISYSTRGMEYFYYQIPRQREINSFSLTIAIDRLPNWKLNYPEGCLTPMEIKPTSDGQGSILVWTLDHAITTSGMGVAIPQPEQPGAPVLRVLLDSPYSLTLLIATVSLTLLILGEPVRFVELALLSAAYCTQFLLMATLSDYFFGFWGSLILGAALTSLLTFLLFRKSPSRLLRVLVSVLILFFTLVYPLDDYISKVILRDTFQGLIHVALIIYFFVLSLYSRLRVYQSTGGSI